MDLPSEFDARGAVSSSQIVTLPNLPELFESNFLDILLPPGPNVAPTKFIAKEEPSNPMIDALKTTSNRKLTANHAPAYSSTSSPTLDAFQNLYASNSRSEAEGLLERAWGEDPELTLKIIWNIRSIHDGRGKKKSFYRAFGWLYMYHPRTAISNLHLLVKPVCTVGGKGKRKDDERPRGSHGCWKDLLNILVLIALDQTRFDTSMHFLSSGGMPYTHRDKWRLKSKNPAARIRASIKRDAKNRENAHQRRAELARERYSLLEYKLADPKFRALYIAVSHLFATRLAEDLRLLDKFNNVPANDHDQRYSILKLISLAGKWAPTPGRTHDRHMNISTAVALLLRASRMPAVYPTILADAALPWDVQAMRVLRSFYQRWVLTQLRTVSAVPEPLMAAGRWKEIPYQQVSSVCMRNNAEHFHLHDPEGFEKYLEKVEKGWTPVSGATLMPHELVAQAVELGVNRQGRTWLVGGRKVKVIMGELRGRLNKTKLRVIDAQWRTLIEKLREAGSIENAIAVCDVSGSMGSIRCLLPLGDILSRRKHVSPILPAIALSLVLANLAKPPFNSGFITFSESPEFVLLRDLESRSLCDIVLDMVQVRWEMNTNLNAVFLKLILPLALQHKVKKEDMIKRVFIFTDMQFDDCQRMPPSAGTTATHWSTNHDEIERAYKAAGYDVPEIVYWDLARYGTVETRADRKGVAMMNGFSPAMLKVFMGEVDTEKEEATSWESVEKDSLMTVCEDEKEEFNPLNVMKKAVGKKSFEGLVVVD